MNWGHVQTSVLDMLEGWARYQYEAIDNDGDDHAEEMAEQLYAEMMEYV